MVLPSILRAIKKGNLRKGFSHNKMVRCNRNVALRILFKFLICFQKTLSRIAWALGPVCVLVAFCLIGLVIYVYFTGILPFYLSDNGNITVPFVLHLMIAIWLSYNLPFNYYMCITTNPGRAPVSGKEKNYN